MELGNCDACISNVTTYSGDTPRRSSISMKDVFSPQAGLSVCTSVARTNTWHHWTELVNNESQGNSRLQ